MNEEIPKPMSIAEIEAKLDRGEQLEIPTDGSRVRQVSWEERHAHLNDLYREVSAERNELAKQLVELRRAFQWPFLDVTKLNELQMQSIHRVLLMLKQAHFTNLQIRINGDYETVECDWLKHLVLP